METVLPAIKLQSGAFLVAVTIENVLVQAGDTSPGRKTKSVHNRSLEKSSNILRRAYRLADILSLKRSFVNTIVKVIQARFKSHTIQEYKRQQMCLVRFIVLFQIWNGRK